MIDQKPLTMSAEREAELRERVMLRDRNEPSAFELFVELDAERAVSAALLAALKEFMDMWNSGDSTNQSKRAQQRRAEMWDKANAAVKLAEGRHAD